MLSILLPTHPALSAQIWSVWEERPRIVLNCCEKMPTVVIGVKFMLYVENKMHAYIELRRQLMQTHIDG